MKEYQITTFHFNKARKVGEAVNSIMDILDKSLGFAADHDITTILEIEAVISAVAGLNNQPVTPSPAQRMSK